MPKQVKASADWYVADFSIHARPSARIAAARDLVVDRFAHHPLTARAWELRYNVSFYDGLYVALAETMNLALLTADHKLVNADGPRCEVIAA